jgi:hypothetical protein
MLLLPGVDDEEELRGVREVVRRGLAVPVAEHDPVRRVLEGAAAGAARRVRAGGSELAIRIAVEDDDRVAPRVVAHRVHGARRVLAAPVLAARTPRERRSTVRCGRHRIGCTRDDGEQRQHGCCAPAKSEL